MTPEQQRIAIAEACGWVAETLWVCTKHDGSGECQHKSQTLYAQDGQYLRLENLPRYLSDLNAMHEAEKVLDDEQYNQFAYELYGVVTRTDHKHTTRYYCATAAQRAEAFLRAIGKWKQD